VTSSVSVALELAVLLLAAGLLFAYWRLGRQADRELAQMVDKAIPSPTAGRRAAASARASSARIVTAPPWLRQPFVYGIRRTWGITLSTLWTMLFAVAERPWRG